MGGEGMCMHPDPTTGVVYITLILKCVSLPLSYMR